MGLNWPAHRVRQEAGRTGISAGVWWRWPSFLFGGGVVLGLCFWGLAGRGLSILRPGSAPPRVFLFLLPQEKEPKEGEPSPPALRASLRCSVERGGCGTRPLRGLKQSSPKPPRPPCAARRGWKGEENQLEFDRYRPKAEIQHGPIAVIETAAALRKPAIVATHTTQPLWTLGKWAASGRNVALTGHWVEICPKRQLPELARCLLRQPGQRTWRGPWQSVSGSPQTRSDW